MHHPFYCDADLWLKLARHANDMADRLAAGLIDASLEPVWPVQANEVFVALPAPVDARLRSEGAVYHPWRTNALPPGLTISPGASLIRLVTSFATCTEDVDRFVATARMTV